MAHSTSDVALEEGLKIVSWNINGIRAAKSPLKSIFDSLDADIVCLQETKTTRDLVDETVANVDGYNSYFSFSRRRSGYSGVATYCRHRATPVAAEDGLTGVATTVRDGVGFYNTGDFEHEILQAIDGEGRAVLTKHSFRLDDSDEIKELSVINVYCPRADPDKPDRLVFKLQFYEILRLRAEAILNSGCHLIILGDINTSHKPIDHCDPGNIEEFSSVQSRVFLDSFLVNSQEDKVTDGKNGKFVDTFRHFHPDQKNAFTCWRTTTGARQTNYGTRLDYIFADEQLIARSVVVSSEILPHVIGSDHCPVKSVLRCTPLPSSKCPSYCTKYWPEFTGRQTKLLKFLERLDPERDAAKQTPTSSLTVANDNPATRHKIAKQTDLNVFFKSRPNPKKSRLLESGEPEVEMQKSSFKDLSNEQQTKKSVEAWKAIFKGSKQSLPLCAGHGEPCVQRSVKKPGPNFRRDFYACARPEGHSSNPESNCNFFKWATNVKQLEL